MVTESKLQNNLELAHYQSLKNEMKYSEFE